MTIQATEDISITVQILKDCTMELETGVAQSLIDAGLAKVYKEGIKLKTNKKQKTNGNSISG